MSKKNRCFDHRGSDFCLLKDFFLYSINFLFYFHGDSYIVHDHITAFSHFHLWKDFDIFHEPLLAVPLFLLDNIYDMNL